MYRCAVEFLGHAAGLAGRSPRGSALECAAILDAFGALRFVEPAELVRPTELLERVVSMLTRMARN